MRSLPPISWVEHLLQGLHGVDASVYMYRQSYSALPVENYTEKIPKLVCNKE